MQSVVGETFLCKNGNQETRFDEIANIPVIALYFTANWCPPCRQFVPLLQSFYTEVNNEYQKFEIIFVSSDKDPEGFNEFFGSMPWIAIPYGDSRIQQLKQAFKVAGIPMLVLLNKDGSFAYGGARADVTNEGAACFERWLEIIK